MIVTAGIKTLQEIGGRDRAPGRASGTMTSETIPDGEDPVADHLISAMNRMMLKMIRRHRRSHGERLHRKKGHDQGDPSDQPGRITPGVENSK